MPQIPFAFQCSIDENQLLPLKDSVDGNLCSTPVTNIPEFEYYLQVFPNGDKEERRGKTCIFLQVKFKNVKKVEADYTLTIESANYFRKLCSIYKETFGRGHWICLTEEFFESEKKFIVDGKVTVKINGIFKFETDGPIPAEIGNGQQNWIGGGLGNESWKMDGTKDVTIVVGDKEIKVHKFILNVRSEVFTAMFNSNMTESKENKVTITDFSFAVVDTGIKLIYECDFTSKLSMDELMNLLQFFDKYQILSLKAKIESLLIAQLSPTTVVDLTNGSILTNSFKLKQKCMDFLSVAFAAKTPLAGIKTLDKDIALQIIENSFYQHVEIKK